MSKSGPRASRFRPAIASRSRCRARTSSARARPACRKARAGSCTTIRATGRLRRLPARIPYTAAAGGGRICYCRRSATPLALRRLVSVDEREGDTAVFPSAVHPGVVRPPLHQHVARLEMNLRIVEQHVDLARDHDGVVDALRAVHARVARVARARSDSHLAQHGRVVDGAEIRGGRAADRAEDPASPRRSAPALPRAPARVAPPPRPHPPPPPPKPPTHPPPLPPS